MPSPIYNLFVVVNPWQLTNALEAARHFRTKNNVLVVIGTLNHKNTAQIDQILQNPRGGVQWYEIVRVSMEKPSNFLNYAQHIKHLRRYSYHYLFVGWNWFEQLLIANLKHQQTFIIEDGAGIINTYRNIKRKKWHIKTFLTKKLRFLCLGLKITSQKPLNFFTSFQLEPFSGSLVVKHALKHFTQGYHFANFHKTDCVYLIGQPLVEKQMMSAKNYAIILQILRKHYVGRTIYYIPHRDERISGNSLMKQAGIEVLEINQPIEAYFLENQRFPSLIVGFFSSALINLSVIFQKNSQCYYLPIQNSQLLGKNREVLNDTADYFQFTDVKPLKTNVN